MSIDSFIKYVYDLARKDGKGNVVSPAAIINWLTYVMLDDFNSLMTQALTLAEQRQVKLANVIFDIKDLRQFVNTKELTERGVGIFGSNVSTAEWTLPTDFKYELGCTAGMINVELLSSTLLPKYRGSVLNGNPEESPKGFIGAGVLSVIPTDLSDLVLVYLRTPAKPYYDFCMDSNDAEIFMPVGSKLKKVNNVVGLYDKNDILIKDNVSHSSGQSAYDSLTVDLDWDETNQTRFLNAVAHKLGINLKNPILTQTQ